MAAATRSWLVSIPNMLMTIIVVQGPQLFRCWYSKIGKGKRIWSGKPAFGGTGLGDGVSLGVGDGVAVGVAVLVGEAKSKNPAGPQPASSAPNVQRRIANAKPPDHVCHLLNRPTPLPSSPRTLHRRLTFCLISDARWPAAP